MEENDLNSLREKILKISNDDFRCSLLRSLVNQLPLIINTLSILDRYACIQEQRISYLSFLFYFDPRILRATTLISSCSVESVKNNRNNLIKYFLEEYPAFNSSLSIALYESTLDGYFIPPKVDCFKRGSEVHISFKDQMTKSDFLKYMDENWDLVNTMQSSNERINKKIVSETLVDFLIYFGFSTDEILKFTDLYFSEETGLENKIKNSFTKESIRSQKSILKKRIENDSMYDAYCKYLKIIEDKERFISIVNKEMLLSLSFNNDTKKFDIEE